MKTWSYFLFYFLVKIRDVMVKSNLKLQEKERTTHHNLTVSSEIWGYFAVWEHKFSTYTFYLFIYFFTATVFWLETRKDIPTKH